jgi:ABC-type nitrate/sulfonate/bicarbonate transport system permease component
MTATSAGALAPVAASRRGRRAAPIRFVLNPWVIRIGSLLVFLLLWQYFGRSRPYSISDPVSIWHAGQESWTEEIWPAFQSTLGALLIGVGIAIVIGIALGLLMAGSRLVELVLSPYVSALYATPRIAILPVLLLWMGVTYEMRVAIVVISAVFPILLNTYLGAREARTDLQDAGRAFGASHLKIYCGIVLRDSLRYVFAGIRVGFGKGLIGIVVAEILTGGDGLGNLIVEYARYFRIDKMFVAVVVLGVFALVMTNLLRLVEVRLTEPWVRATAKQRRQNRKASR